MKRGILYSMFIVLLGGCSDGEDCVHESVTHEPESYMRQKQAFQELSLKLDSLNARFVATRGNKDVGDYIDLGASVASMDAFGWEVGCRAGFWVGGWLGGFGGMVSGYYIGGLTAGAVLSAIHYVKNSDMGIVPNEEASLVLPMDHTDVSLGFNLDSVGYYHNKLVNHIYERRSAFLGNDSIVKVSYIATRVNMLTHTYGICDVRMNLDDIRYLSKVALQADSVKDCYLNGKINLSEMNESMIREMQKVVELDSLDLLETRLIYSQMMPTCVSIDPMVVSQYVKQVQKLVDGSELPTISKQAVKVSSIFVANSALCVSRKSGQ